MYGTRARPSSRLSTDLMLWLLMATFLLGAATVVALAPTPLSSPSAPASATPPPLPLGVRELGAARAQLGGPWAPAPSGPSSTFFASSTALGGPSLPAGGAATAPATVPQYMWTNLTAAAAVTSPPARYIANMAWDDSDHEVVLFGGLGPSHNARLADTWTYVNGTWSNVTSLSPTHPDPRSVAEMAFDPSTGDLLLYSGLNASLISGPQDLWSFHANVWTNITATVTGTWPPTLTAAGVATDHRNDRVVFFGGSKFNLFEPMNFTYALQNDHWTNLSSSVAPPPAAQPNLGVDPVTGLLVEVGGFHFLPFDTPQTWVLNGSIWSNVTATQTVNPPSVLRTNPATFGGTDGMLLAQGAYLTKDMGYNLNPGWAWSFSNGQWTNISSAVQPIFTGCTDARMVGDPYTGSVLLSGGVACDPSPFILANQGTWMLNAPLRVSATATGAGDVSTTFHFNASFSGGVGQVRYAWSLGDGTTVPSFNASHTYAAPGRYLAAFGANDLLGGHSSQAFAITVSPDLSVVAQASPSATDVGGLVQLAGTATGGTGPLSYVWDPGDGSPTLAGASGSHRYLAVGTYTARLNVSESTGAVLTTPITVTVVADPTLAASASPASLTAGGMVNFTATPTGGTTPFTYRWNFTDGSSSTASAPAHRFAAAGVFHVYVTATDAAGVTTNSTVAVTVVAPLAVTVSAASGGATVGVSAVFTAAASGGVAPYTYAWDFGDGSASATGISVTHSFATAGNYTVKVTATDAAGTQRTAAWAFTALPPPPTASSGGSNGSWPLSALIAIVVLAAMAALFALLYLRRRRGSPVPAASTPPPVVAAAPSPEAPAPRPPVAPESPAPPPMPPAAPPPAAQAPPPPGPPPLPDMQPPAPPT